MLSSIQSFLKKFDFLVVAIFVVLTYIFATSCTKEESTQDNPPVISYAPPPCDTLENVVWGDTLRVVKNTITTGSVRRGIWKGKTYWQAMLYSNNFIEPTRFQNEYIHHRIVIADTVEITNSSIFIVARVK